MFAKKITFSIKCLFLCLFVLSISNAYAGDMCKTKDEENYNKIFSVKKTTGTAEAKNELSGTEKIELNAYIENSGSIDGYVNGISQFKTDIYSILSNSVVSGKDLKLFYINSQTIPQGKDPKNFVLNLTTASFKSKGGNRSSSDLAKVIDTVMGKASADKAVMLASDFIFSPERQFRNDVKSYLNMQQEDVKNTFEKFIKKDEEKNMAVVLLQGISGFDGWFYNAKDVPFDFHGKKKTERPYYLMIAGGIQPVAALMNKTAKSTHFINSYSEFSPVPVRYEADPKPSKTTGSFRLCRESKHHLEKIKADMRSKKFKFSVNIDFSNVPLHDSYLLCGENENGEQVPCINYKVSAEKFYKVESVKRIKDSSGFTHEMLITTVGERIMSAELEVKLVKNASWIEESNDPLGEKNVPGKTFGLKHLMDGMAMSYSDMDDYKDYYAKFKFYLEK